MKPTCLSHVVNVCDSILQLVRRVTGCLTFRARIDATPLLM